jgi:hypothetical protein
MTKALWFARQCCPCLNALLALSLLMLCFTYASKGIFPHDLLLKGSSGYKVERRASHN